MNDFIEFIKARISKSIKSAFEGACVTGGIQITDPQEIAGQEAIAMCSGNYMRKGVNTHWSKIDLSKL